MALARRRQPKKPRIQVSVESFAREGTLGPIALGWSPAQVEELLGPPTDSSTVCGEDLPMWRNGDMEMLFASDYLHMIHSDTFRKVPKGGGGLMLDPWVLRNGLLLDEPHAALRDAAIPFETRPDITPGYVKVVTPSSVYFLVCVEPQDECDSLGLLAFGKSDGGKDPEAA